MSDPNTKFTRAQTPGFTLVELLVVVAILLLVAVTAIPLLSPSDVQKVRDAAITVNGMVSRVKTAAAKQEQRGAGMWLQPLGDGSGAVLDMFTSLTLDPYSGDDPEAAAVFVYKPCADPETRFQLRFPDGKSDARLTFAISTSDELRDELRVLFFPVDSCSSIWEICRSSSQATIAGSGPYEFKLLPRSASAMVDEHLPQPYRPWDTDCKFDVVDDMGMLLGDTIDQPYHPDFAGDPEYDYRVNAYEPDGWRYNTVDWTTECFIGIIQPPAGVNVNPTNQQYYGYRASLGTPANSPSRALFSIARPNTRAPTPPLTLPSGYAIDLQWSGWGNTLFRGNFGENVEQPVISGFDCIDRDIVLTEPVQLMFDKDGMPKDVVFRRTKQIYRSIEVVDAHFSNLGDIFLLIGRADRCGQAFDEAAYVNADTFGANWQYPDSRWIRISRSSGQVTISEPYPNARTLRDSLYYAKSGITAGRG